MYDFYVVDKSELNVEEYENFPEKKLFTTLPWLEYLENLNNAEPTIIRIVTSEDKKFCGYLTGMIIKKFGVRIFGSPFKGWGTCYMGFDLHDYSNIRTVATEAFEFILCKLKCTYIELVDRNIPSDICLYGKFSYRLETSLSLEMDINRDDDTLLKSFKKDCRNSVRQFEKKGARLLCVEPDGNFAARYCEHLKDVFAKQGLVPTYGTERVNALLSALKSTDNLLCIEVVEPNEQKSIAASIVLYYKDYCYTWGTSSNREYQSYRPNEKIRFFAMQYCREKGCKTMDLCGRRAYKYKFNPYEVQYTRVMVSKYNIFFFLRNSGQKAFQTLQKVRDLLKK